MFWVGILAIAMVPKKYWLMVWNMNFIFPFLWGIINHPNWRTHIFQRGSYTTNQYIAGWSHIVSEWIPKFWGISTTWVQTCHIPKISRYPQKCHVGIKIIWNNKPSPSHHHRKLVCSPFPVMSGLLLFYHLFYPHYIISSSHLDPINDLHDGRIAKAARMDLRVVLLHAFCPWEDRRSPRKRSPAQTPERSDTVSFVWKYLTEH